MRVKCISLLSVFSIFIWRLPVLSITDVDLKINPIKPKLTTKSKEKKDWKTKLHLIKVRIEFKQKKQINIFRFKYISIRIEQLNIEYENTTLFFQRIALYPGTLPNSIK